MKAWAEFDHTTEAPGFAKTSARQARSIQRFNFPFAKMTDQILLGINLLANGKCTALSDCSRVYFEVSQKAV